MPKKCHITGKTRNNGYAVSHSHIRTKKIQEVNLQNKKIWSPEQNRWIRVKISTKAIKTLLKKRNTY
uniref:ribosomal protein L28 n=1 Tax=Rhodochorton tenue TaxID=173034 RepID=UPI002A81C0A6|nr:ribosomal protein L28 [Rhodochorton tenue]WOK79531.1 ribosomal protein L28 [Rhodochorton tenue]